MNGHNSIKLIGNLVADPVSKTYPGGTLAEITLAVNNNASKAKTAQYFKATAFGALGDVFMQYQKKGASVLIDGRIRVREYTDKNGAKRKAAELIINDFNMLGDGSNAGENTAHVLGTVVAEPTVTTLKNGTTKTTFRLAINNGRRKQDPADFIDVVTFDKQAEAAGKILAKGKNVYVQGRLETRSFERKDGTKGDSVEIVAQRFTLVGGKKGAAKTAVTAGVATSSQADSSFDNEEIPF